MKITINSGVFAIDFDHNGWFPTFKPGCVARKKALKDALDNGQLGVNETHHLSQTDFMIEEVEIISGREQWQLGGM